MSGLDQPAAYVVKIQGSVDVQLADWLGPMEIDSHIADGERGITTLARVVTDQAGIVGLIRHLHGLGIVLLSVERRASGQDFVGPYDEGSKR